MKFQTRVSDDELREMEVTRATRQKGFEDDCRKKDAEMQNRIKNINAINTARVAIEAVTVPLERAHPKHGSVTATLATTVSTLIIAFLIAAL